MLRPDSGPIPGALEGLGTLDELDAAWACSMLLDTAFSYAAFGPVERARRVSFVTGL